MENAANALLIAAGVLIAILIISLGVFLFADFSASSREVAEIIHNDQLVRFNAEYTIYANREDITIYDIIAVASNATQNNLEYDDLSLFETNYEVVVKLDSEEIQGKSIQDYEELIKLYSDVLQPTDTLKDGQEVGDLKTLFKSSDVEYHENARVKYIEFNEIR